MHHCLNSWHFNCIQLFLRSVYEVDCGRSRITLIRIESYIGLSEVDIGPPGCAVVATFGTDREAVRANERIEFLRQTPKVES